MKIADRVWETTESTGTGAFVLQGAVDKHQTFEDGIGDAEETLYAVVHRDTGEWIVARGTYTHTGTELSRAEVLASSAGGSNVDFTAGDKDVFVTYAAGRAFLEGDPVDWSTLVNVPTEFPPEAHALGGAEHNADTLANLNSKISDATLDDAGSARTPTEHGNEAHSTDFAPLDQAALTLPTITDYIEALFDQSGTSITIDLSNGTVQRVATTGNATVTLPSVVAGKSFVVIVEYGGAHSITWAGGTAIEWAGGTAPDATSESGKVDIFAFFQDAGATYGSLIGQDF